MIDHIIVRGVIRNGFESLEFFPGSARNIQGDLYVGCIKAVLIQDLYPPEMLELQGEPAFVIPLKIRAADIGDHYGRSARIEFPVREVKIRRRYFAKADRRFVLCDTLERSGAQAQENK